MTQQKRLTHVLKCVEKLMLRSYDHIVNIFTPIFLLFVIQLNSSLELVLYLALVPQDLSKEFLNTLKNTFCFALIWFSIFKSPVLLPRGIFSNTATNYGTKCLYHALKPCSKHGEFSINYSPSLSLHSRHGFF